MHVRGELCVSAASILAFASVALLVFCHIGQINTSSVPRGIAMVAIDMSGYSVGLEAAVGDPAPGLYSTAPDAPLGVGLGLRQLYKWGLYSTCGFIDGSHGICTPRKLAHPFKPATTILADTPDRYGVQTRQLITPFTSSDGSLLSVVAYYMLLVGSIFALMAFLFGLIKSTLTFLLAFGMATLATLTLTVSAAIWTSMIRKTNVINSLHVLQGPSLGIRVDFGMGLWLLWAADAAVFFSILPYLVSCATYRR